MKNPRSYLLVGIQFAAAAFLLYPHPVALAPWWFRVQILAVLLAGWALVTMRLNNLSVLPDPKQNALLVTGGPYKWIRHPMYTAVLLYFLALVIDQGLTTKWIVWSVLAVDLVLKLRYEEGMLRARFPEYAAYCAGTRRLIPFIF